MVKGRNPIREKDVRPTATVSHWHRQRKMWAKLVKNRMSSEKAHAAPYLCPRLYIRGKNQSFF